MRPSSHIKSLKTNTILYNAEKLLMGGHHLLEQSWKQRNNLDKKESGKALQSLPEKSTYIDRRNKRKNPKTEPLLENSFEIQNIRLGQRLKSKMI